MRKYSISAALLVLLLFTGCSGVDLGFGFVTLDGRIEAFMENLNDGNRTDMKDCFTDGATGPLGETLTRAYFDAEFPTGESYFLDTYTENKSMVTSTLRSTKTFKTGVLIVFEMIIVDQDWMIKKLTVDGDVIVTSAD